MGIRLRKREDSQERYSGKDFNMLGIKMKKLSKIDSVRRLKYGAPPHAGFAFGIDRLSLCLQGKRIFVRLLHFQKRSREAIL